MSNLNKLIDISLETDRSARSVLIELKKIVSDPTQPRKKFEEDKLKDLADSMDRYGLMQPIVVQRKDKSYEIITGERRFRAAQILGWKKIKATLLNEVIDDTGYRQMIENLKREALSVEEIADFIAGRLNAGESQKDIAEKLGFSKSVLSQYATWTSMPDEIRKAVKTGKVNDIQAAYVLYQQFKKQPEKVTAFVENNSSISQAEARNFDKKTEKTAHEKDASNIDESFFKETFKDSPSNKNSNLEEDGLSENDEDEVVSEQPVKQKKPQKTDSLDVLDSGADFEETENEAVFEESSDSEIGGFDDFSESEIKTQKTNKKEEKEKQLEEAADSILENDKSKSYKNPLILCLIDKNDCELLYKRKAKAGFVFVKFDDGREEQVLAEKVVLNRIIEA